jgi:hypothetical protein
MTDMTPIFDSLGWPQHLRPVEHRLIETTGPRVDVVAECSCLDWAMDSLGTDESSRSAVNYAFKMHVKREASK